MGRKDVLKYFKEIKKSEGTIFRVDFIKKDGSYRKMLARLGVSKGITGKGMSYNPLDYDLLPVFDMTKLAFRMINFRTIQTLPVR